MTLGVDRARTNARHQPPSARDAAHALERGGVVLVQGRVQEGARVAERDPAGGRADSTRLEIIGRPYTTNAGKDAHARVQKVGQPGVTEVRTWGAHERIAVRRE
jgi:hypothetical protein